MTAANSLFLASASAARAIDDKVRGKLRDSLPWLAGTFDVLKFDEETAQAWTASPTDFGFYYELASAIYHDGGSGVDDSTRAMAQILAQSVASGGMTSASQDQFAIGNLSPEHYSEDEVACLKRWFDLEPDNSMALLPLDPDEFEAASAALDRAAWLLRETAPEFYGELTALTTEMVFAKPGPDAKLEFGGASAFSLWGALALNAEAHPQWWHYLPRLVHECSHNLLFGIASDEQLVLNAPEERYLSPLRETMRPIDGIYHACYVTARETMAMDTIMAGLDILEAGPERNTVAHFCEQTAAGSEEFYHDCMGVLTEHAKLTTLGQRVLDDTAAYMSAR